MGFEEKPVGPVGAFVESDHGSEIQNTNLETYLQLVDKYTLGPQVEGLDPWQYEDALNDPDTITSLVEAGDGQSANIPVFTHLKYAPWINETFLQNKGYTSDNLYFCAVPQALLADKREVLDGALEKLFQRDNSVNILIDYPENSKPFYENRENADFEADKLETSVGTQAATYHYSMDFSGKAEELDRFEPDTSMKRIDDPAEIDRHFERIWDIYSRQFKGLVDDHPIEGALPKEELYNALVSDSTKLIVYTNDHGTVDAFGYVVSDLDLCPWLNKNKMIEEAGEKPVLYMPGIAAAPECSRSVGAVMMQNLLYDVLQEKNEWNVTFECSNISSTYIPKLVQKAFHEAGIADFGELRELKHLYEVVTATDL